MLQNVKVKIKQKKEIDIVRHWFIFKGKKMYDSAMAKH